MSTALAATTAAVSTLSGLLDDAARLAAAAKAEATLRAYAGDWRRFAAWCEAAGLEARPAAPATVAAYIAHLVGEGRKVATIERALVAVSQAHKVAGLASPTTSAAVAEVRKGARRTIGVAQRQAAPLAVVELRAAVEESREGIAGLRDRALVLVGFAAALRRSELVALRVEDLDFTVEGLVVTVRKSKTDQESAGRKVAVPYAGQPELCPVRAARAWLDAAGIVAGPVFRSVNKGGRVGAAGIAPQAVARVVKRLAGDAGLDADKFSGHSLRAGFATAAARAGKAERSIMRQTGHKTERMVRRYIRDAELWADNAAVGLL